MRIRILVTDTVIPENGFLVVIDIDQVGYEETRAVFEDIEDAAEYIAAQISGVED